MEPFSIDRPLNFAHRGASHEAPENTLAAFLLAAELGADGIEFDVRLSRDGEVVVIHDASLERTTNGQGLVRDRTLAELKQLDAGSWFDPAFAGESIPTLQEVIERVGHRLLLNIEVKTEGRSGDDLVAEVVRLVEDHQLLDRVILSSFHPLALRRAKQLNPRVQVGLLHAPDQPLPLRRAWLHRLTRLDAVHPHHTLVNAAYMRWARRHGYRVHPWTCDDPADMVRMISEGVELIITNRPDRLRQVLAERGSAQPSAS